MSTISSTQMSGAVSRRASYEMGDGTAVEAAFFGEPGTTRFGVTHLPESPNGRGVVICSPIYNDYLKNNRREVLLARQLARSGFTVQRFHYSGTGNSEGEIIDMTVDSMMADTEAAAERLLDRDEIDDLVFMGTRMGAVPAANAGFQRNTPVAMWEPIEGPRYFRELFRIMAIIEMNSDGAGAGLAELKARFETDRSMDAAGFVVGWAFYDSADRSLADTVGQGTMPLFLAQFREKPELKAEYAKLVAGWEEDGRTVTRHHVLVDEAWMLFVYGFRPEEDRIHSRELIDETAAWFGALA